MSNKDFYLEEVIIKELTEEGKKLINDLIDILKSYFDETGQLPFLIANVVLDFCGVPEDDERVRYDCYEYNYCRRPLIKEILDMKPVGEILKQINELKGMKIVRYENVK